MILEIDSLYLVVCLVEIVDVVCEVVKLKVLFIEDVFRFIFMNVVCFYEY